MLGGESSREEIEGEEFSMMRINPLCAHSTIEGAKRKKKTLFGHWIEIENRIEENKEQQRRISKLSNRIVSKKEKKKEKTSCAPAEWKFL